MVAVVAEASSVSLFLTMGHGADCLSPETGVSPVTMNMIVLQPLVALIAGVLILIIPRLLNIIVAIYLIVVGITGLLPNLLH